MPRKIKVYKCESDGRNVIGVTAVVAHYDTRAARKLLKDRLTAAMPNTTFGRMLVTEVPDLAYTGPTPSIVLWSHYVQ